MALQLKRRNWQAESKFMVENRSLYSYRERFAAADVNAGATILPATSRYRYRLVTCGMVAIGGAAAGATTVDVLATQNGAVVKLMPCPVANLTQNKYNIMGATSGIVDLPDGGCFQPTDPNTAITIGKTGSNLSGATHIDIVITYSIVK